MGGIAGGVVSEIYGGNFWVSSPKSERPDNAFIYSKLA